MHASLAVHLAAAALAGCAALGPGTDLPSSVSSVEGFTLHLPSVSYREAKVRVRGAVCRDPLSVRRAPRSLTVTLVDDLSGRTVSAAIALRPLPVGGSPQCVHYASELPMGGASPKTSHIEVRAGNP